MDKGLATPKFLYRKHMGCWLHPRTLGMHLRQLRIDVYMYKYIYMYTKYKAYINLY